MSPSRALTSPVLALMALVQPLLTACADDPCSGEVKLLSLDLTIDQQIFLWPYVYPVADWWYIDDIDAGHLVSSCADKTIELPPGSFPNEVPESSSVLYCDDSGLHRIDLDADAARTRIAAMSGCEVGPADGLGGYFVHGGGAEWSSGASVVGLSGTAGELYRVPSITAEVQPELIHPYALGPYELADGWYVLTSGRTWSRIDPSTHALAVQHDTVELLMPSPRRDAWLWAPLPLDPTNDLEVRVHHLDGTDDVTIDAVSRTHRFTWNETGTHLGLRSPEEIGPYVDTTDITVFDARTGAQTTELAGADGWNTCGTSLLETHGTGFLVCRAEDPDSFENPRFHLDPTTGAVTLIQRGKSAPRPGSEEGDHPYQTLGDGRYIVGQSVEGYPLEDDLIGELDRRQIFLVDPETGTRAPLMVLYSTDRLNVYPDREVFVFSDAERDGIFLYPFPSRAPTRQRRSR